MKKEEWNPTCERFVGFIDIMGFKDMVARKSHEEIYKMMLKIVDLKNFSTNVNWSKRDTQLVRSSMYSDSIMIYSKDASYESADSFLCTMSSIINALIVETVPFKGSIAFGKMTLDEENSIFFGQPLIDAYLLQEELNFYGLIIHSTAETELIKMKQKADMWLYHYLCPLKKGFSKHYTVAPMFAGDEDPEDKEDYNDLVKGFYKYRLHTSGHLRTYIDNTEKYLSAYKKWVQSEQ